MKIIVTGATGFIGQHLVSSLLSGNHEVIAVGRNSGRVSCMPWHDKVKFITCDIHSPDAHEVLSAHKADALAHLAWHGLPNYNEMFHFEKNLPADFNFIKGMVKSGCGQVLVTGTCFEYGLQYGPLSENLPAAPATPYALAKDTLRRFLTELKKNHPFTLQWARLFYMYGAGQNPKSLLAQLDTAIDGKDSVFNMSGGEQLRDFLPVGKLSGLLSSLLEHSECDGIFNCCSGTPVSVRKLVEDRIAERSADIKLNLGYYPYPSYEPMAFWGDGKKLAFAIGHKEDK